MDSTDINLDETYVFTLGQHKNMMKDASISWDNPSKEFLDQYDVWGDVDGLEVAILAKKGSIIRFHVIGDPITCWAVSSAEFFFPTGVRNTSNLPPCKCNLWVAGCVCGFSKAEKQGPTVKVKKWRYVSDPIKHGNDEYEITY